MHACSTGFWSSANGPFTNAICVLSSLFFPVSMCQSTLSPSWTRSLRAMFVNIPLKTLLKHSQHSRTVHRHLQGHIHSDTRDRPGFLWFVHARIPTHYACASFTFCCFVSEIHMCHVHSLTKLCVLSLPRPHSRQSHPVSPHHHRKTMRHQADSGAFILCTMTCNAHMIVCHQLPLVCLLSCPMPVWWLQCCTGVR